MTYKEFEGDYWDDRVEVEYTPNYIIAEVAGIDKIIVNGKVYLAADKALEIVESKKYNRLRKRHYLTIRWARLRQMLKH